MLSAPKHVLVEPLRCGIAGPLLPKRVTAR